MVTEKPQEQPQTKPSAEEYITQIASRVAADAVRKSIPDLVKAVTVEINRPPQQQQISQGMATSRTFRTALASQVEANPAGVLATLLDVLFERGLNMVETYGRLKANVSNPVLAYTNLTTAYPMLKQLNTLNPYGPEFQKMMHETWLSGYKANPVHGGAQSDGRGEVQPLSPFGPHSGPIGASDGAGPANSPSHAAMSGDYVQEYAKDAVKRHRRIRDVL